MSPPLLSELMLQKKRLATDPTEGQVEQVRRMMSPPQQVSPRPVDAVVEQERLLQERNRQIEEQLASAVSRHPEWSGQTPQIETYGRGIGAGGGIRMITPDARKYDIRDEEMFAKVVDDFNQDADRMAAESGGPAVLPAAAPRKSDPLRALVQKVRASDPGSSTYRAFPPDVVRDYGIPGVDVATLTTGEKILLRRMGVSAASSTHRRR